MLRRIILPAIATVLAFSACRHEVDVQPSPPPPTTTPTNPTPTSTPTFGISGDTAVTVMQARSVDATILLSDSGAGKEVTLDIVGVSANLRANLTTNYKINPPGQAAIRITAGPIAGLPGTRVAPVGSHTVVVRGRMANGAEKTHAIRVQVVENPNCVELKAGTYTATGCGSFGNVYVTADTAAASSRISLAGFPTSGRSGFADLNCATNTLVFPNQSYGTFRTFSGAGTFSRDTMAGVIYLYNLGVSAPYDSCDFIIKR